jgi:hypothetical protein
MTQVWVQVGEYPWWPAKVVEGLPEGYDEFPEGVDTVVQYYQTNDIGFINIGDTTTVAAFDDDEAKTAVEMPELQEAIAMAKADALGAAASDDDDDDDEGGDGDDAERKRQKKEKKARKKQEKRERREREEREERERALKKKAKKEEKRRDSAVAPAGKKEKHRASRGNGDMQDARDRHDAELTKAAVRRAATDDELRGAAAALQDPAAGEQAVLAALRPLGGVSVSLEQLYHTKVGVAVGNCMGLADMPYAGLMAQGVLQCWHHDLDVDTKIRLATTV